MSFTTQPTWIVEPVPAADLASMVTGITELRPIVALKSADETVNNSATLQNDDHLVVALAASTTYIIELDLIWNSGTTPDIQYGWTTPASVSGYWNPLGFPAGSTTLYTGALGWAATGSTEGQGADAYTRYRGVITTTSAGNLTFRWAQSTANASNTIVRASSLLVARKVT